MTINLFSNITFMNYFIGTNFSFILISNENLILNILIFFYILFNMKINRSFREDMILDRK